MTINVERLFFLLAEDCSFMCQLRTLSVPKHVGLALHIHKQTIVRTLKEDQPLRLLLNLFFYHLYHSEPTYKSQRIKLLDVIAVCNQLNVNALN